MLTPPPRYVVHVASMSREHGRDQHTNLERPPSKRELNIFSVFSCFVFILESRAQLGPEDMIGTDNVLTCAVENNQVECLQILLDLNIWGDILSATMSENPRFRSLVWLAIDNNSPECLDLLIKHGAFIEQNDPKHGYTPVFYATLKRHAKCLDILLAVCPSIPNQETRYLRYDPWKKYIIQTPLQISAALGDIECLKVLLGYPDQRRFMNLEDEFGGTAFWYAASRRHTKCMQHLLEAGASPGPAEHNQYYSKASYPSIGAVLHHKHVCMKCKLDDIKACGGLRQPKGQDNQDYLEHPHDSPKKCIQCTEGECSCDALEDCLEMFSVDYMQKYIGRIPRVDIDSIERLLNDGLIESIRLVQPETLRLILSHGANLYLSVNRWLSSVSMAYGKLVREGYQFDHGLKNLVVCVICFLQCIAFSKRNTTSSVKQRVFDCLRVLLDYYQSVDKLAVKHKKYVLDVGEAMLMHLAGGTWIDGLKFVLEAGVVKATYRTIFIAATFHQMPMKKTKLLLFHEASVNVPSWLRRPRIGNWNREFSTNFKLDEVFEMSSLLLAAGFHKCCHCRSSQKAPQKYQLEAHLYK